LTVPAGGRVKSATERARVWSMQAFDRPGVFVYERDGKVRHQAGRQAPSARNEIIGIDWPAGRLRFAVPHDPGDMGGRERRWAYCARTGVLAQVQGVGRVVLSSPEAKGRRRSQFVVGSPPAGRARSLPWPYVTEPSWSSDGAMLAALRVCDFATKEVFVRDRNGSAVSLGRSAERPVSGYAWCGRSPVLWAFGCREYGGPSDALWSWDVAKRQLADYNSPKSLHGGLWAVSPSPDGRRVAAVLGGHWDQALWCLDVGASAWRRLTSAGGALLESRLVTGR
jgi:hypothetical protein